MTFLRFPFFRNLFLATLVIVLAVPAYLVWGVYPSFEAALLRHSGELGVRAARHLGGMVSRELSLHDLEVLESGVIIPRLEQSIEEFGLYKLRLFSSQGQILYSSEKSEVGQYTSHDYFFDIVAQGETYSKLVQKGGRSAEGVTLALDVVESYVPVMQDGRFVGALETYTDITAHRREQQNRLLQTTGVMLLLELGLLFFLLLVGRRGYAGYRDNERNRRRIAELAERHTHLLNSLSEGVVGIDADSRISFINEAARGMLGLDGRSGLCGSECELLCGLVPRAGEAGDDESCPIRRVQESGVAVHGWNGELWRPDHQSSFPVSLSVSPIEAPGRVGAFGVVVTFIDTTERHAAEEALRDSEQKYRSLLETTSEGFWLIDPQRHTLEVNDALCRMLGYPREVLIGKSPTDFADADNRAIFQQQMGQMSTSRHRTYEITLVRHDGSPLHTLFNATTLRNRKGQIVGGFALVADISERRRAEQRLAQTNELLSCIERLQSLVIGEQEAGRVFEALLRDLLELTGSHYGFIAELREDDEGRRYQAPLAITNVAPEQESQNFINENSQADLRFSAFDGLSAAAIVSGEAVIANEPAHAPHSNGRLPEEHPPLAAFLGLPLRRGEKIIGSIGMANRIGGYDEALVEFLEPVTIACSEVIERYNNERYRKAMEQRHRLNEMRLDALLELSRRAGDMDEAAIIRACLEEAEALTESEYAYLHFVDETQRVVHFGYVSDSVLEHCERIASDTLSLEEAGEWVECIHQRIPVIQNSYSARQETGLPLGECRPRRHMAVPVMEGERVRVVLGVADKRESYDGFDLRELQLIAQDLWEIVTRRRSEIALDQARRDAESANRAKSAFLANMSHELRTPLNAMLGYAQILQRDQTLEPNQQQSVAIIKRSGDHLLSLINDVLDLAKVEAGRFTLVPGPCALPALLQSMEELFTIHARGKGIDFFYEGAADLPRCIEADEKRLHQVLMNLLGNALKFTEQGQVSLSCRRLPEERGGAECLQIDIADTGIGIPAERIPHLFKPFQQEGSASYRAQGTGLGLAISSTLIQQMGGVIEVESELGRGSLFRLILPLHRMEEAVEDATASELDFRQIEGYQRSDGSRRPLRLLVVDDLADNRAVLSTLLRSVGLLVDECASGEEAVTRCREERPDMVLMDLVMPGMDGLETTRRLHALPGCDDLPVVICSSSAFAEDRANSLAAGCIEHIAKPIQATTLFALLAHELTLNWQLKEGAPQAPKSAYSPSPDERKELLQIAKSGRILELQKRLKETNGELEKAAKQFDIKRLIQLLESGNYTQAT